MTGPFAGAGRRGRAPRDATPPGTVRLVLRPFGYLAIGLVWLAIALLLLGLYVALGVHSVSEPVEDQTPWWEFRDTVGASLGVAVGLLPFVTLLAGPVAWYMACATWPLAALSFVHVGRSLRPAFRGEPLSRTTYAMPGTTLGPPTPGPVALSLIPVRESRLTTVLLRFYACGWQPADRDFVAALPAGLAWAPATAAVSPLLATPVRAALAGVALALYAWSAVLLREAWLRRFHPGRARRTPGRRRADAERARARTEAEPLTALTSDAIGERREAVLRARERRLRAQARRDDGRRAGRGHADR
ncbi:hypothetical protein [Cellulosimicrobium cellulans]|uniref:hypothetical protein n=1 Tax=Cellulosimicrobium cellulans TaxID=1710 RepID=UPI0008488AE8|nr:hypothetical protein [Cellulosimicrobium cellulans]